MTCPHEFWEREASVFTEGYCPICMAEEIKSLKQTNPQTFLKTANIGFAAYIITETIGRCIKLASECKTRKQIIRELRAMLVAEEMK